MQILCQRRGSVISGVMVVSYINVVFPTLLRNAVARAPLCSELVTIACHNTLVIWTPEEGVLGAPPVLQVEGLQKVCGQQLELLVCDISVAAAVAAGVDQEHPDEQHWQGEADGEGDHAHDVGGGAAVPGPDQAAVQDDAAVQQQGEGGGGHHTHTAVPGC